MYFLLTYSDNTIELSSDKTYDKNSTDCATQSVLNVLTVLFLQLVNIKLVSELRNYNEKGRCKIQIMPLARKNAVLDHGTDRRSMAGDFLQHRLERNVSYFDMFYQ